ncbi:MAG: AAA family ATPase [Chloroflexi bacterium]|nr:AAA family ATPase [Chloroflexota bacterium]
MIPHERRPSRTVRERIQAHPACLIVRDGRRCLISIDRENRGRPVHLRDDLGDTGGDPARPDSDRSREGPTAYRGLDGRYRVKEVAILDNAGLLLETKLYAPRWSRGLVPRSRLTERLNRGAESKLVLVSAPAGFGKTTLLAEWLKEASEREQSVAWLSLDPGDSRPASFWTYLIAALRTTVPGVGMGTLALLQSPQPPPMEAVLIALLNELAAIPDHIVLVLDDYHAIDARGVQDGMAFLLNHLPPQVHLVIASRADPALPLARLRARGELAEIRAADLRFTRDEAAAYLNAAMGLDLAARDIAALEARTEGWIAALQLAALSMQGRDDIAGFIAGFAGDDRYIVDYLVEEVLQRQAEPVRTFLLETSILGRLSGPLCDEVTGRDGGKAMLEALERGNLFLVPLDDRRRWYRYHHLFADVLRAHLVDEQREHVPDLRRRACRWYEQNGERTEAIRHALVAEDFPRAADLVELAVPALRRSRHEAILLGWLQALPDALISVRPVLSAVYGGALLATGQLEHVESRLRDAERWLDSSADRADLRDRPDAVSAGMVVVDDEEFRRLPGSIAVWRAGLSLVLGRVAETVTYARRALDLVPEDDLLGHGGAAGLLGLAAWASGDLELAHRTYAAGMASLQRAGHVADVIGGAIPLAAIRIAQGRLHEAMRTYEQAIQLAAEQGEPAPRGTADLYLELSELLRERDDLPTAAQYLLTSKELSDRTGFPLNRSRWCAAMARIHEARGDLDGALDLLEEAGRLYVRDFFPDVRPVAALKARVWVIQGRLGEALGWVREQGLLTEDDLSYLREFEHITLARVLLAQFRSDREERAISEAIGLLERLLAVAEDGGRMGSVIEVLVLQALAHQLRGDIPTALAPLQRALTLAEPEGYVRIFVDEGPRLAELLEVAAQHGIAGRYVRQLLAAFGKTVDSTGKLDDGGKPVEQDLVEPLSERELDVLRLLRSDLDGPDIARQLMVSLNTMRTHTKNIYAKLGVNNRRAAVSRADELGLFTRTRTR